MSNFVQVKESRYGDELLLNINNVVAIHEASGTVYTNAVHGDGNGNFKFDTENMAKIIKYAKYPPIYMSGKFEAVEQEGSVT